MIFYLILAAALVYNLFLIFSPDEKDQPSNSTQNEFQSSSLPK